ncbi:MAG: thioredoxin domain-containing protein [Candidatus Eisenbacteria sp.]|nr:thioredoxin domain-containing protein [Candidatus Eisenbacteria bacterium]
MTRGFLKGDLKNNVRFSSPAVLAGIAFLVVSLVSSLLLALGHFGALSVPGCGANSPCAEAAASTWGKIPVIDWPVAFLGFAYFAGVFAAYLGMVGGVTSVFRAVVSMGALISLGFMLVILIEGYNCTYCIISHAGNFAFWILVERSRRVALTASMASWRPIVRIALVFSLVSVALGLVEWRERRVIESQLERELTASMVQIIAAARDKAGAAAPSSVGSGMAGEDGSAGNAARSVPEMDTTETAEGLQLGTERPWTGGFRGRYLYGPEVAPIRLVIITDYQCIQCRRTEEEAREMLEGRQDVSLSIKHFPMNSDCNDHFGRRMHPNACWAARAAEAAGILGGHEGFWKMHFWLFEHRGSFTNEELTAGLREFGFDRSEFIATMTSDETMARIQADIEEGVWLGLHYTPMVFINGVQLKGITAHNAVPRAVAQLAADNPLAMTHDLDQPPPASEKYISDWRDSPLQRIPPDRHPWIKGPRDASIKIVMWGDYQEPNSAKANGLIEGIIAGQPTVSYAFRQFPVNQACNPVTPVDKHPLACRAAQAAEAAGVLGGTEGYWKMHTWLMHSQEQFGDEALREAAAGMGFDPVALFAAMEDTVVGEAIEEDCRAGMDLGLESIPLIMINGRRVPRWQREGDNVLERIISEAQADADR